MLTVRTWCLPDMSQDKLEKLHNAIVAAVASIPETGVKSERDMLDLFPADKMTYGLGMEIEVEIIKIPFGSTNEDIRHSLAAAVGEKVQSFFPDANVSCEAEEETPKNGRWSTPRVSKPESECNVCFSAQHMSAPNGKCPRCGRKISPPR